MTQHIGIVACSAEGAALCYTTICTEGARNLGSHAHPEVSIHTHSLAAYVACLDRGDLNGVGDLMLSSAEKLARIGADFLICPDNTIHQAFLYVEPSPPCLGYTSPRLLPPKPRSVGFVVSDSAVHDGLWKVTSTLKSWPLTVWSGFVQVSLRESK